MATSNSPQIPGRLLTVLREKHGALFVGAGASRQAGLPSWKELVDELAGELNYSLEDGGDPDLLVKIPQYYESEYGRRPLMEKIREILERRAQRGSIHKCLANLPVNLYYTTNFDTLLEDEITNRRRMKPQVIASERMARQLTELGHCQVRKIHGTIGDDWDDVVITRTDFARLPATRPIFFQRLADDLASHVFLFVGYSLRDPDFIAVYDNMFRQMAGKHQTHFLALADQPKPLETDDLKSRGFQVIEIWNYPGNDRSERLRHFLELLVDNTSEQIHLRRFYRELQNQAAVTIVVGSSCHETERYLYYPGCDIDVAHQLQADLRNFSVTSSILPDERALRDVETTRAQNVILIGSPKGNKFTGYVFCEAEKIKKRFKFKEDVEPRILLAEGKEYSSPDPTAGNGKENTEYALVARYQNPWRQGSTFSFLQELMPWERMQSALFSRSPAITGF